MADQLSMDDIDALDDPKPDVEDQYEDADETAIQAVDAIDEKQIATELATRLPHDARVTFNDMANDVGKYWRVAKALAVGQSEKRVAEIFQSMIIGVSLGLSPASAVTGIHVIQGRLSLSCHLIAGVMRESGWDIVVEESDPPGEWCRVTAKRDGSTPVAFKYSIEMATKQGLIRKGGPWTMNPWDMLYARAVSIVGRRAEPGRLAGFYAPEEFGKKSIENRGSRDRLG